MDPRRITKLIMETSISKKKSELRKGHTPWNKVEMVKLTCKICTSHFKVIPSRKDTASFCSMACRNIHYRGQRFSSATEFKKGQTSPNKGKKCPWARNNPQAFTKGFKPWNFRKSVPQYSGEKHWNWKGGVSEECVKIRQSVEYKAWRDSVFARDNYTCVWCGDDRGGNLEADHIKPFAYFPELRLSIDNGRTLCSDCHKKTDTWGERAKRFAPRALSVAI